LGQIQADEIWVKAQGMILWFAMALQVSTRLWLGAVVSPRLYQGLMQALIERVRRAALYRPLLFCVDGLASYLSAMRNVFREPIRTGKPGRPRLRLR
jgi:transposase-like protein